MASNTPDPEVVERARALAAAKGFKGKDADEFVAGYLQGQVGTREAVLDTRKRIGQILRAPEAMGREEMACYLAFETDQPAITCVEMLKRVPQAESSTPLDRAMRAAGSVSIPNQPGPGGTQGGSIQNTETVYATRKKQTAQRSTAPRR